MYQHNGQCIKGSPLIFLDALMAVGISCQAVFFEVKDDLRTELIKNVAKYNTSANLSMAFHSDHCKFLPCYFEDEGAKRPRKKFGLVYADPSGSLPPFELLGRFFQGKAYSTLDVLIYLTSTNLKRQLMASTCPIEKRLTDYLALIPKRHWILRKPMGQHQWTFFIGTNWDSFPAFNNLGFYRLDSAEGRQILAKLNYTNEELNETQHLRKLCQAAVL